MNSRLLFLIRLGIFWMLFFFLTRLLFMTYYHESAFQLPLKEWWGILVHGTWMDLSMTGYIMLLCSILTGMLFFSQKISRIVLGGLNVLLLLLFVILIITDIELYRHWSFRIDITPLFYLETPSEALASMDILSVLPILLLGLLIFLGFLWLLRKYILVLNLKPLKWFFTPVFFIVAAFSIIPIRGGFGLTPMNQGMVYFSKNAFSNHASLNPVWNFAYSLSKSGDLQKEYPDYVPYDEAVKTFTALTETQADTLSILNTDRPNIVIILLEGISSKVIGAAGGLPDVTPGFNALSREGLFFSKIYASGDRTNKGLVATISGFPAQSDQAVIKNTLKASRLPSIARTLLEQGYHTSFLYGGDPAFSNISSYLYNTGIQQMTTEKDFPESVKKSKWGVHDEHLFHQLLMEMDTATAPCFKLVFTLSSHEPFDIPDKPRFPGNDDENKYLSSVSYTDKWLSWFFTEAKNKSFYKNTLFVILSDHGHRWPGNTQYSLPEKFRIPMLWLGGALNHYGTVDVTGSQTDMIATLLAQMKINADDFHFSRNLLAPSAASFAYYAFNDGFGFVTPDGSFVWDHIGQQEILPPPNNEVRHQAFSYFTVYQHFFVGL